MTLNPGIQARIDSSADMAREATCPRCAAPVLRANRVGRVAAVAAVVDIDPIDADTEARVRATGRLTWRVIRLAHGTNRLAWRDPQLLPHDRAGPVHAEHACPPQPVQEVLL